MGGLAKFVSNVAGAAGDVVGGAADIVEDVAGGAADIVEDVAGGAVDVVGDVFEGVGDVVEDVAGGVGDVFEDVVEGVGDVVEDVGGVVDDVWDTASDIVEDAWDNDIVRTAALVAGAYYGGSYLLGSTSLGSTVSSAYTGLVDKAFLAGYSPNLLGVAGYGLETLATSQFAQNVATNLLGGAVGGAGGGGQVGFVPKRLSKGPSTQYGQFGARAADLGINADVADGMMKVANSNLAELQQFRRDVNRTATLGPTIELGSAQLGGIGVRSTTRDVS